MNIWNNVRWSIFFLDSRRRRRRAGAHTSLIEHSWVRRGISLLECENDGETAEEEKNWKQQMKYLFIIINGAKCWPLIHRVKLVFRIY